MPFPVSIPPLQDSSEELDPWHLEPPASGGMGGLETWGLLALADSLVPFHTSSPPLSAPYTRDICSHSLAYVMITHGSPSPRSAGFFTPAPPALRAQRRCSVMHQIELKPNSSHPTARCKCRGKRWLWWVHWMSTTCSRRPVPHFFPYPDVWIHPKSLSHLSLPPFLSHLILSSTLSSLHPTPFHLQSHYSPNQPHLHP